MHAKTYKLMTACSVRAHYHLYIPCISELYIPTHAYRDTYIIMHAATGINNTPIVYSIVD